MTSQISMSEINLLARENLPFASFVHLFRLSGLQGRHRSTAGVVVVSSDGALQSSGVCPVPEP